MAKYISAYTGNQIDGAIGETYDALDTTFTNNTISFTIDSQGGGTDTALTKLADFSTPQTFATANFAFSELKRLNKAGKDYKVICNFNDIDSAIVNIDYPFGEVTLKFIGGSSYELYGMNLYNGVYNVEISGTGNVTFTTEYIQTDQRIINVVNSKLKWTLPTIVENVSGESGNFFICANNSNIVYDTLFGNGNNGYIIDGFIEAVNNSTVYYDANDIAIHNSGVEVIVDNSTVYTNDTNSDIGVTTTNGGIFSVGTTLTDFGSKTISTTIDNSNNKIPTNGAVYGELTPIKAKTDKISTTSLTYYVDATNGSDSNDGLTSATAFKTIMKAVNMMKIISPNANSTNYTIYIGEGTYTENVTIEKAPFLIRFLLSSDNGATLNGNFLVVNGSNVSFPYTSASYNRTFTVNGYFSVSSNSSVMMYPRLTVNAQETRGVVITDVSLFSTYMPITIKGIASSTVGVDVTNGSNIMVRDIAITDCNIGIRARGGVMQYGALTATNVSTKLAKDYGGMIKTGAGVDAT